MPMIPCRECREEMEPDSEGDLTCKKCRARVHSAFRKLTHRLSCKACWNYWVWYDFKQWLRPFKALEHVPLYYSKQNIR